MPNTKAQIDFVCAQRAKETSHNDIADLFKKKWPGTGFTSKRSGSLWHQHKPRSPGANGKSEIPAGSKLAKYAHTPKNSRVSKGGSKKEVVPKGGNGLGAIHAAPDPAESKFQRVQNALKQQQKEAQPGAGVYKSPEDSDSDSDSDTMDIDDAKPVISSSDDEDEEAKKKDENAGPVISIFVGARKERFDFFLRKLITRSTFFKSKFDSPKQKQTLTLSLPEYSAEDFEVVKTWVECGATQVIDEPNRISQVREQILRGIRAYRIGVDMEFVHLPDSITSELFYAYKKFDMLPSKNEVEMLWSYHSPLNGLRVFMLHCLAFNHLTVPEDDDDLSMIIRDEDTGVDENVGSVITREMHELMVQNMDFGRDWLGCLRNIWPGGKGRLRDSRRVHPCQFHDDHEPDTICWLAEDPVEEERKVSVLGGGE